MLANLNNEKFFLKLIHQGKLKVTKSGKAFNLQTGKEIARENGKNSYRKISWKCFVTNKIKQIQLHRLVWAFYKGVPKDVKLQLNHKDGFKQNCDLKNLELVTNSKNIKHAIETGLRGPSDSEFNNNANFTNKQVVRLRKEFATCPFSLSVKAEILNTSKHNLKCILVGKTYKSVKSKYTNKCYKIIRAGSLVS